MEQKLQEHSGRELLCSGFACGYPRATCWKQSTGLDGSLVQSTTALMFYTPVGQINHATEGQFASKPGLYLLS